MNDSSVRHYLLIKQDDVSQNGESLTADAAAKALLAAGFWPLWIRTRYKHKVAAGDKVAIYLAGAKNQKIIATAAVREKGLWSKQTLMEYPLTLMGKPEYVLFLEHIELLKTPVMINEHLEQLSFVKPGAKWGVQLMGGMREVSAEDFRILTTQ